MATPEQRKEAAKKLRDGGIARNVEEAYTLILSCVGIRPQLPAETTYTDAMARLADLIDPTCDFEESYYNDEFALRLVSGYICHNCGHEAIVERCTDGWAEPPHYCPNCGVRMVNINDAI